MKPLLTTCQRVLLLFALLAMGISTKAQTYTYYITNEAQTAPNVYEFDAYLLHTGGIPFELANCALGLAFDTNILNGGVITPTIVGLSDLNTAQIPTSINIGGPVYSIGGVPCKYINVAAKANPGAGAGTIISGVTGGCSSPGTRIARYRLTNTVPFRANSTAKHVFSTSAGSGRTNSVVSAYVAGLATNISNAASHLAYNSAGTCIQNIIFNPASTCAVVAGITTAPVACFGNTGGSIEVTLSGSGTTATGTYSIDGGPATPYATNPFSVQGLLAGAHSITVTTTTPCTTAATPFTIGGPAAPVSATCSLLTNVSCNGGSDGSVSVVGNGGTGTLDITPPTFTGLTAGDYTYTVTDDNGCFETCMVTVTQPSAPLAATAVATDATCPTCADGSLTIGPISGGTPGYNVTPTSPQTGLLPGVHCFTVTDANSCTTQACATVGFPAGCNVVATCSTVANVTCFGGSNGVASVSGSGGVAPYVVTGGPLTGLSAGSYTYTVTDDVGCFATCIVTITEPAAITGSESFTACDTYTFPWGGATTTSGSFSHTYPGGAANGCDSTATAVVTIITSTSNSTTASACDSYTWSVNGQTYTASGTYTSVTGCHTETLVLTITPSTSNSTTASACDSYTWSVNGQTYTTSGTYTSVTGCHTETLVLTITASTSNSTTASACDTYTWSVNGQTYTTSGTYTSVTGCHTETLVLTITASTSNSTTASACDSYTWSVNGQTYTASGTYTSVTGCHTETLVLTINPSTPTSETVSACDSYTWAVNGQTYTASGTYTSVTGCNTATLILTITASTSNSTTASACDSYTWSVNGQTYTTSGTYTSVTGCHTETLVLTITPSTSNSTTASACDSYTWSVNGTTYTASGTYTSVTGCHTETLVLTITASTSNSTTASGCDSYTWSLNGTTYTASGTYTSVTGCHTEILVLTITPSTSNSTTASGCGSYTWSVNGTTYTASGTYTSVTGCHTEILVLTITPSTSNSTTASACDSYTWSVNGQTYTASGTYTSVTGCHTETLVLTITPSTSNSTTASGCDSYTWSVNGTTYTASGTYTSVTGCHTETLVLTITPSTSNSTTASACDSYTWSVNGQTYTASGTYTSVTGCHTETLVLTITPTSNNSTNVTSCGPYTWSVNGQTYTVAGTYTSTTGCTSETIVLTISNVVVTATPAGSIVCFGGSVIVNVSATGGTEPYTGTGALTQFAGTVVYTVSDGTGCTGSTSVTLTEPTKVEGTIATTPATCGFNDGTATVTPSGGSGGYTYLWSNGQTGTTATGLAFGPHSVTITDNSNCSSIVNFTISGAGGNPDPAGPITGATGACIGTVATYSIAPVANATSYTWTLPTGATGTSSTNSITVTFGGTFTGGFICVTPNNSCGNGGQTCTNISLITVKPAQPGFIVGNANPCGPNVFNYSIPPSANAQNYIWTVTGTGVTILSGQGSNSVQVSIPAGFGQGTINVKVENCIGVTSTRTLALTGIPTHSNALIGPGYVCANTLGVAYTIGTVNGAGTSYAWTTSGDISVASFNLGSVVVNFGPAFTTGVISITTSSSCGSFTRNYTIRSTPFQPGSIAGPSSNLCGQSGVTYSIAPIATATSYNWTVPVGVSIVANTGLSITVDFTAGFTGTGNICVSAVNGCGSSIARCYSVTARPAVPIALDGTATPCKTSSVVYSTGPVAGATSYIWSVTGGATITPAGTSATINFNTATSSLAIITMNAVNACGASQPRKKTLTVNLGCRLADGSVPGSLSLYPNPTNGMAKLSFNAETAAVYIVKVTDLLGNIVSIEEVHAAIGSNMQEVNLSNAAKGMYLISLESEGVPAQTLRLVVE